MSPVACWGHILLPAALHWGKEVNGNNSGSSLQILGQAHSFLIPAQAHPEVEFSHGFTLDIGPDRCF